MKLSLELAYKTPKEWAEQVVKNMDAFLQDHADCERKASTMAMSLVAKAPDKTKIIPGLIDTALEELEHFKMVYEVLEKRGIPLAKEIEKDIYVQNLIKLCRSGAQERFLDRLLLGSIIECRGAERFKLVYEALEPGDLKDFYKMLWISEAKHGNIYVKFALEYYDREDVFNRLEELNEAEGKLCAQLKWRPALH